MRRGQKNIYPAPKPILRTRHPSLFLPPRAKIEEISPSSCIVTFGLNSTNSFNEDMLLEEVSRGFLFLVLLLPEHSNVNDIVLLVHITVI